MASVVVKAFFIAFVVSTVCQGLLFGGDKDKEPKGPPQPYGTKQSEFLTNMIKGRIESISPEPKKFVATASSHIRNAKLNYAKLPANVKQELKATFPLTTALSENPIVDQTVNKLFVK
ncbi:hypothetical protein AAVH_32816 [Aphelenchoides avenae]|nr:hypothetical protein AAVH_32816 [Aphelenchus avenae]